MIKSGRWPVWKRLRRRLRRGDYFGWTYDEKTGELRFKEDVSRGLGSRGQEAEVNEGRGGGRET